MSAGSTGGVLVTRRVDHFMFCFYDSMGLVFGLGTLQTIKPSAYRVAVVARPCQTALPNSISNGSGKSIAPRCGPYTDNHVCE